MIDDIYVLSRNEMQRLIRRQRANPRATVSPEHLPDDAYVISMRGDDEEAIEWDWEPFHTLKLIYDDAEPRADGTWFPDITYFSEEQAKLIIDFVVEARDRKEAVSLFVNCEAGVSRSSAVAFFAAEICAKRRVWRSGLTFPNKHVDGMLRRVYGKVEDQAE